MTYTRIFAFLDMIYKNSSGAIHDDGQIYLTLGLNNIFFYHICFIVHQDIYSKLCFLAIEFKNVFTDIAKLKKTCSILQLLNETIIHKENESRALLKSLLVTDVLEIRFLRKVLNFWLR